MAKAITDVALIGLGAVGAAYLTSVADNFPECRIRVIAAGERAERLRAGGIVYNGKKYLFIGTRFGCCFDAPASGCQVELPVDARRFPFYRLVVDNGGSAPLETVRLLGCAERRRIVFESRAPELILAYGGEAAVVRPESRAVGEVNSYTAGPEEPNPAYETGGVNWVRWILAAAVGIMAVILVSLLWQGYQSIVK